MATGDPPASGDLPPGVEGLPDLDVLAAESSPRGRRRSRRGLRVPADVPPPPDTHPSLDSYVPDTTIGALPEGFDPEARSPGHTLAEAELSHGDEVSVSLPPPAARRPDSERPPARPLVARVPSIPPPPPPSTVRSGSVPPPASIPLPSQAPSSLPPPSSSSPPDASVGGPEGGSSMRVVRRRIIRKVGSDEAVLPQAPPAQALAVTDPAPPTVPAPPAVDTRSDDPLAPVTVALPTDAASVAPVTDDFVVPPSDDFDVPPVPDAVHATEGPSAPQPPVDRPMAPAPGAHPDVRASLADQPLPELPDALGNMDFEAPTPIPVLRVSLVEVTVETENPPPSESPSDDDGVEVSIDDGTEGSSITARDPSLAMLDALAELPADAPVALDMDVVVQMPPRQPGVSLPPPPPPDAARPTTRAQPVATSGTSPSAPSPPTPETVRTSTTPTIPDKRRRRLWWEELFNEDYFRTMEKFSPAQVKDDADWIEQALGVEAGASILDVACGVGRQSIELARRGYDVVALDLSPAMLVKAGEAAQGVGARLTFTHGDMAAMEFTEVFDSAYCVGTSFGFFDDDRNAEVARRMHRALKPHGTFLLEVVNRDHAIQRQPDMAWFEGEGCVCMEETSFNYITSRLNVKRTMIFEDGRQREVEYSIRLYSLHELGQILHEAGFRILEVSGHKRTPGAFFGPSSRDLIILAQKRGPEVVEIPGLVTSQHDAQPDPAHRG